MAHNCTVLKADMLFSISSPIPTTVGSSPSSWWSCCVHNWFKIFLPIFGVDIQSYINYWHWHSRVVNYSIFLYKLTKSCLTYIYIERVTALQKALICIQIKILFLDGFHSIRCIALIDVTRIMNAQIANVWIHVLRYQKERENNKYNQNIM